MTLAAAGKTVKKGGKMDVDTRNRDVAAIALYALGIEKPSHMSAKIPANLFEGVWGELRPTGVDRLDRIVSYFAWLVTMFTAVC